MTDTPTNHRRQSIADVARRGVWQGIVEACKRLDRDVADTMEKAEQDLSMIDAWERGEHQPQEREDG